MSGVTVQTTHYLSAVRVCCAILPYCKWIIGDAVKFERCHIERFCLPSACTIAQLFWIAVRARALASRGSSLVAYQRQVTPVKCLSAWQSTIPIDSIISNVMSVCRRSFA